MSQITITGQVTDSLGGTGNYSVIVNIDHVTITSAAVSPDPAPAGTLRTLTVAAQSDTGAVLTFGTPTASGVTFTPVNGQPAGTAKWTFTV